MKRLYLHGFLKEKYGEWFELDVANPAEAVRALAVQLPGFERDIENNNWHVVRGPLEKMDADDDEKLTLALGKETEIHLLPALTGAKSGWVSVIVGAVLIVAGFVTQQYWAVGMGVGMAVGGIIQMTTKLPSGISASSQETADQRPSFLFSGPTNTSTQGLAVPRGYGRAIIGSIVVSATLYAEELAL